MPGSDKTRVLLIGGGGVGAMAAYALESGGQAEVSMVLRSNYDIVQQQGFRIDSIEHGQGITGFRPSQTLKSVPKTTDEGFVPFEYILVCTKNVPDVKPTVADLIESAVTPGESTIVLLQNGLNIERPVMERFPGNVVLSGVSFISASEPEHGHIVHEFHDLSKVGPFPGSTISSEISEEQAKRFVGIYNACGKVNCQYDENVPFTRWRKLVYNASFNSVSAILKMGVITMRKTQHIIDELIRPAMLEIIATAKAAGVDLPEGLDDALIRMDPVGDDFIPSMGQDAIKGNYMELENIVGEPVREAERLGVPVPTLRTIYSLLKGLQVRTKLAKGDLKVEFGQGNPYA